MGETKKLGLIDLIAISCGQVIGAGVVTLIGTAIVATGTSAWLAYGAAVVAVSYTHLAVLPAGQGGVSAAGRFRGAKKGPGAGDRRHHGEP